MSEQAPATFDAHAAMPGEAFLKALEGIDLDAQLARMDAMLGGKPGHAAQAARQQIAAQAAKLWTDPDYSAFIEWLLDSTLRRPMFLPQLGNQGAAYCAWRDGENSIIWKILQAVAEGRNEAMPSREGV